MSNIERTIRRNAARPAAKAAAKERAAKAKVSYIAAAMVALAKLKAWRAERAKEKAERKAAGR